MDPHIAWLNERGFGVAATIVDSLFMSNGVLDAPKVRDEFLFFYFLTFALVAGLFEELVRQDASSGRLGVVFLFVKESEISSSLGLYIADEVQAGFNRSGETMWGHQVSIRIVFNRLLFGFIFCSLFRDTVSCLTL